MAASTRSAWAPSMMGRRPTASLLSVGTMTTMERLGSFRI